MGSGLVWFFAGILVTLLFVFDKVTEAFKFVAVVVGGLVTFLLELGVVGGVLGALALIGITLLVGREWSERARGTAEAKAAFDRRNAHR